MAEPGAKLGQAFVEIRGDGDQLSGDVRREASKASKSVRVEVPVHADADRLREEVTRAAKLAGAGQDVRVNVRLDKKGDIRGTTVSFRETTQAARETGREVDRASRSVNRFGITGRDVRRVGREFGQAGREAGLAAAGLTAVGGALSLIAATGPAAVGLLAATPAVLAAIAQGGATAALGLAGVGDAVKALAAERSAAGDDAIAASGQQSAAAEAVRAANERVRDSELALVDRQRDARRAQQDLTDARNDARRRLQDLRFEVAGLALDEKDAALGLEEARQRLTEVFADKRADDLDRQRALLGVEQAERRVEEVGRRNAQLRSEEAAARKAGVEGDRQVVAAKERVAEASRSVREASRDVRLATEALGRAGQDTAVKLSKLSASQRKVRDAFAELSPEAQRFAKFLFGLDGTVERLQRAAGKRFLPGLQDGITFGLHALPEFEGMLLRTGSALGTVARDAGRLVGSGPFRTDFATLAANNADAIEQLGGAGVRFTGTIVKLAAAADPVVDVLTDLADTWSRNLQATIDNAAATGKLTGFFGEAADNLDTILDLGEDVLGIVGDLGRAAFPAGQGLLGSLAEAADNLHRLTSSTEGQAQLKAFFGDLSQVVHDVAEGTGLAAQVVGPLVRDLVHFAAEHENLAKAAGAIALLAVVGKGSGLFSLLSGLGRAVEVVGKLKRGWDAAAASATAAAATERWTALSGVLGKFVGAGGILAALVGGYAIVGAQTGKTRGEWDQMVNTLATNRAELERTKAELAAVDQQLRNYRSTAIGFDPKLADLQRRHVDLAGAVAHAERRVAEQTRAQAAAASGARDLAGAQRDAAASFEQVNAKIREAIPLFGGFARQSAADSTRTRETILGNLRQEVRGYTDWERNVRTLLKRGVDPAIVQELSDKGPEYVAAFVHASDRELRDLEGLMERRTGAARRAAQTEFDKLVNGVNRGWTKLKDGRVVLTAVARLFEEGVQKSDAAKARHLIGVNKGGPIPGSGDRDTVPAMLTPGEHVWTKDEVRKAGGHEVMRSWRQTVRGYATGGEVGADDVRAPAPVRRYAAGGAVLPRARVTGLAEQLADARRQAQFMQDYATIVAAFNLVRRADESRAGRYGGDHRFGSGSWTRLTAYLAAQDVPYQIISTFRPGARTRGTGAVSYHARNRAVDLRGDKMQIWDTLRHFPGLPTELIYSPAPYQIYTGGRIHRGPPSNPLTRADHYDHVHAALAEGGIAVKPIISLLGEKGREAVIPLDDPKAADMLGAGLGGFGSGDVHVTVNINGAGMTGDQIEAKIRRGIAAGISEGFAEARRELIGSGGRRA